MTPANDEEEDLRGAAHISQLTSRTWSVSMGVQDDPELCFPQLLNTSCRKPLTAAPVSIQCLLSVVSVLTVTLNLLVIISISHFRQLHTPTNLLLLFLAVTDFLVGLVIMPVVIYVFKGCWAFGNLMCAFLNYVSFSILSLAVGNMLLISVDRYVAICDPLQYPHKITMRRVSACICLCWLLSFIYNGVILRDALTHPETCSSCTGECQIHMDFLGGAVDAVVTFLFPVSVIVVLYMRVFVVAVSQARAMRSHISVTRLRLSGTALCKKSELKAARTLGVVIMVFLMCFSPYYCVFVSADGSLSFEVQHSSLSFAIYCVYFNSCLNPVIYALFYPWFRKAVKVIVTLQILQANSREISVM